MLELTIRLLFSLAVVVGLLLLLTRLSARRIRGPAVPLLKVVERKALSRTSAISVVTVVGRVLVIGTTEHEVRLLTEFDASEIETELSSPRHLLSLSQEAPHEPDREGAVVAAQLATTALTGSILSTQTWKQAFTAATKRVREGA